MAARDEKISNNRRRLFKALSAAPVVATLKPGSALATSSAYQCLNSGHDISNWHPDDWTHVNDACTGGEPCYVYEYRNYIDTNDVNPHRGRSCPTFHNIIVEIRPGKFMDMDGRDVTYFIGQHSDGRKMIYNSSNKVCKRRIKVRQGLFAKVGYANSDKTEFHFAGTVPERKIGGGYQGITGTCLNSLIPGASAKVLSRG